MPCQYDNEPGFDRNSDKDFASIYLPISFFFDFRDWTHGNIFGKLREAVWMYRTIYLISWEAIEIYFWKAFHAWEIPFVSTVNRYVLRQSSKRYLMRFLFKSEYFVFAVALQERRI